MWKASVTKPGNQFDQAKRKLKKIVKEAERSGFSLANNSKVFARTGNLCRIPKKKSDALKNFPIWIFFACFGILIPIVDWKIEGLSDFWLKWPNENIQDETCIAALPSKLINLFRPPVSCSICRGLKTIEKISNLTPEIFEKRYAYTGKPIVVIDGMTNWTAKQIFNFEFFKNIYTPRMNNWKRYNCQFFPYGTEFKDLAEVFNMSKDRADMAKGTKPWYVGWSNCDDEINRILRKHYEKPYFLPETAETKQLDWIFMGSNGFGAPMHIDDVENPSWQAQLRGKKQWSLYPPLECTYQCDSIKVVVEPGEIIVLDTNRWYHSTLIISEEGSITIGAEYD